jgi:predicted MPP superfamily phosphohydrolase
VFAYTIVVEPHWLEIVRRDLAIANLPNALVGKTVLLVSDIHVGPRVSDDYLVDSFERARALKPDIALFTGDFISYRLERGEAQFAQLQGVLSHFPMGQLATLAVLGNHDYGRNWSEPEVARRVENEAARAGIRVLHNEVASVQGLDVIGIDELWAHRADSRRALAARTNTAAVALCHNPDGLDELPWPDYQGWIFSGHTHGGQCKPPFLPPPLLPVKNRRYTAGEIRVDDRRTVYISRGVGHLIRARFNVRPEMTLFTLRQTSLKT